MANGEFRVIFFAKDYEGTLAFYRDGLELPVVGGWNRGPNDQGTLFSAASGIIEVIARSSEQKFVAPQGFWISVEVDNVDTSYQQARAKGLSVKQVPITRPWGHRDFKLTDPNGIELALFSRP